jgi:hypothetical protein
MTYTKLQAAWDKIRKCELSYHTQPTQINQIALFFNMRTQREHLPLVNLAKKHVKGMALARGQILKRSFVKSTVHVETVFKPIPKNRI